MYITDSYGLCWQLKLPSIWCHQWNLYHSDDFNDYLHWDRKTFTSGTTWLVGICISLWVEKRKNGGAILGTSGNQSISFRNSGRADCNPLGNHLFCCSLFFCLLLYFMASWPRWWWHRLDHLQIAVKWSQSFLVHPVDLKADVQCQLIVGHWTLYEYLCSMIVECFLPVVSTSTGFGRAEGLRLKKGKMTLWHMMQDRAMAVLYSRLTISHRSDAIILFISTSSMTYIHIGNCIPIITTLLPMRPITAVGVLTAALYWLTICQWIQCIWNVW